MIVLKGDVEDAKRRWNGTNGLGNDDGSPWRILCRCSKSGIHQWRGKHENESKTE
jgi:hypothetical protein